MGMALERPRQLAPAVQEAFRLHGRATQTGHEDDRWAFEQEVIAILLTLWSREELYSPLGKHHSDDGADIWASCVNLGDRRLMCIVSIKSLGQRIDETIWLPSLAAEQLEQ